MIQKNILLALVLDRVVSKSNQKDDVKYAVYFRDAVNFIMRQIFFNEWHFRFGKYGHLSAAANLRTVDKSQMAKIIKEGPNFMSALNLSNNPIAQSRQLVLMDFWCEIGQGKVFIDHLRGLLKPDYESIIYFRIKNGKRIAKMITRDDATTFMRSRQAAQAEEGQAFLQTEAARDFYLPTYNTQMAFAQRVGEMALLMVHAPVAAASPLKPVLERIQTCARLEQHRIYASVNGTQTGLLTWAWLSSKCLRAEVFDTNALQAFEWSEGQHLAVVDVVTSNDTEAAIWADLAGQLYPDEDIWLLCKVNERTFFKKWAKNQRQGLLNSDQTRSAVVVGHWHDMAEEPTCAH